MLTLLFLCGVFAASAKGEISTELLELSDKKNRAPDI